MANRITINVGGTRKTVKRDALLKSPVFEAVLPCDYELFVDRDPDLFDDVYLYLSWQIVPTKVRVLHEIEHYGLALQPDPTDETVARIERLSQELAEQIADKEIEPLYLDACGTRSCTTRQRLSAALPYYEATLSGRFGAHDLGCGTQEDPLVIDVPGRVWDQILMFVREPYYRGYKLDDTTIQVMRALGCDIPTMGLANVPHIAPDPNTLPERPLDETPQQTLLHYHHGNQGGAIMHLIAVGAANAYLQGNERSKRTTIWKSPHQMRGHYASERMCVEFNDNNEVQIPRRGDLVTQCYLRIHFSISGEFKAYSDFEDQIELLCYKLVKRISFVVGNRIVDTFDGYQLWLLGQMNRNSKQRLVDGDETGTLEIPFFFTKHTGCALPLVALQIARIKLELHQAPAQVDMVPELLLTYVFLDTEERRLIAQNQHDYLVSKSRVVDVFTERPFDCVLNHWQQRFLKAIYFTLHEDDSWEAAFNPLDELISFEFLLNHHTRSKGDRHIASRLNKIDHNIDVNAPVYVIPFSHDVMDHVQPTSTLNSSRIDTMNLHIRATQRVKCVRVWGDYWDIFRVSGGDGGMAYQ